MNRDQLKTILWLRWRLMKNQWSRGGQLNAGLTIIVYSIGLILGLLFCLAGLVLGIFALSNKSPQVLLIVWDVIFGIFIFVWLMGLLSEIQRSETIDIGRLQHLPASLKEIFYINYLASHLTIGFVICFPFMISFCLGLSISQSIYIIGLLPLVLGSVFMITAWTYYLRGWLVTLMVNKRRRRAVIAGITFGIIVLCQLPNLFNTLFNNRGRDRSERREMNRPIVQSIEDSQTTNQLNIPDYVLTAHKIVPFLWLGNGAMSLVNGSPWAMVLATAGTFGIGWLGLRCAYRSTIGFYMGELTSKKTRRIPKKEKKFIAGKNFIEKRLPGIPEEATAVALAFFRSLMRAPEIKMMLAMNTFIFLIFGGSILLRRSSGISDVYKPFVISGTIAVTFFGLNQLMSNLFGTDRNGFRLFILSPVQRKNILLGKNLACLPIVLCIGLLLLVMATIIIRASFTVLITGILQIIAAFLLLSMFGNLISIVFPFRVAPGSMKRTKMPTLITILFIFSNLMFPFMMLPIFLVPAVGILFEQSGWLRANVANIILSILIVFVMLFFYKRSLNPLGDFLTKREKKILDVVTHEVE